MPFDSNGNANIQRNRAVTGQTVEAAQVNVPFDDVQSMLSQVYVKTGVAPLTGNMNFNGFKPTNVSDPSADGDAANKNYVDDSVSAVSDSISANARKIETLSAARTIVLADKSTFFRVTNSITLPLTQASTLGDGFWFQVQAINGNVIIDPDGSELINGQSTFIIQQGQVADIFCDLNQFRAYVYGDTLSGAQLQGYSFGLTLSSNAGDAANDVDITSGKAAADVSPFNLMVLPSAITKRIDANWVVGTNQGGLDTGSVAASGTYYIWLIQRSDTLVVDVLFSLSNTSPTMPTGYDRKRIIGLVTRESSVNKTPNQSNYDNSELRARVTFNGSGVPSILSAKNISSVVRNSAGNYTINFLSPIIDQYYSISALSVNVSGLGYPIVQIDQSTPPTPTSLRIQVVFQIAENTRLGDSPYISVSVFR